MAVIYDMSRVDAMEGHEFEHFIANLLRKLGYQKVEVTPGSGDQGVDVLAEKDGVRYAIQCKCYSSDLGNTPIQEINTGKMVYHCHVGVVVTNRYFTQSAREAAKATGVLLWDRSKLTDLLAQAQMEIETEIPVQHKEETLTLWSGSPLLRRGSIALKDRDWKKAHQFFDRALNSDPENAEAYLGLVMAETELPDQSAFVQTYINQQWRLRGNYFDHVKEFAGPELSAWFANLDVQRQKEQAEAEAERKRKEAEAEMRLKDAEVQRKKEADKRLTKVHERDEQYKEIIMTYLSSNPKLVVTSAYTCEKILRPIYPGEGWSGWSAARLLIDLDREGKLIRVKDGKGNDAFTMSKAELRRQEEERRRQEEERAEAERRQLEQAEAERRRQEENRAKKRVALESEQAMLRAELSNLRGLFTGRRRREIETRLFEIEQNLKII